MSSPAKSLKNQTQPKPYIQYKEATQCCFFEILDDDRKLFSEPETRKHLVEDYLFCEWL